MQEDFRIALALKDATQRFEFRAEHLEIENFAVENHDEIAARVVHRLAAARRKIDHAQPPMGESAAVIGPHISLVRPPVRKRLLHPPQVSGRRRLLKIDVTGKAAHRRKVMIESRADAKQSRHR